MAAGEGVRRTVVEALLAADRALDGRGCAHQVHPFRAAWTASTTTSSTSWSLTCARSRPPAACATAHTYGHLHAPDKIPAPDDDITPDRLLCPHHLAGLTQEALEVLNEVFDEDE